MKKAFCLCAAIALVLVISSSALSGPFPGTGVSRTFHDLSMMGRSGFYGDVGEHGGLDRVCVYCHAPHHADIRNDLGSLPLWNHSLSTNTVFMMYTTGWYADDIGGYRKPWLVSPSVPGPVSLLCLSCHDGSIAVSAYGFYPSSSYGSPSGPRMRGRSLIGETGNFRNHHPIGIDYVYAAGVNSELNPPESWLLGENRYGLTIYDVLSYGRIECTSCHDVHNSKNSGFKFTWVEDRQSRLCLSCHRK